MTLQILQSCLFCLFDKFCIQFRITCNKRYIHKRTGFFFHSTMEQFALIQEIIKNLCFFLIFFFHGLQTTLFFQPFEYFSADIDAITVRSIVQRIGICVCLIFHHGRSTRKYIICDQIFSYDSNYHTCRTYILLNSTVNNRIFAYVNRFRQEAGRYVCYQIFSLSVW